MFMQREARREIERADALYEEGEQAEAVGIYKENVSSAGSNKGRVYGRIVQHEISNGDQAEAEKWIRKSIKDDVTIESEEGTKLTALVAKVKAGIEEEQRLVEEKRKERERKANSGRGSGEEIMAVIKAEGFVTERLKSPSTADFGGGIITPSRTRAKFRGDSTYYVTGSVDSQNGFGATVRSSFSIEIKRKSEHKWIIISGPNFSQR